MKTLFLGLTKSKGFFYLLEIAREVAEDGETLFNLSKAFERVAKKEGKTIKGIESSVWYFVQNNFLNWKNKNTLRTFFGESYKPPKYGSFLIDLVVKILEP